MKILSHLDLAENEIGDIGINDVIKSAKEFGILEYLDISGNNIGKSAYSSECAENMNIFLTRNRNLEHFKINWNNLRGVVGEKVIDGLVTCFNIKTI